MRRFATWCTGHRKTVIIGWIVALIGVGMISGSVGADFSEDFKLPDSDSSEALELLETKFPAQSGDTATIVYRAEGGVESPAVKRTIAGSGISRNLTAGAGWAAIAVQRPSSLRCDARCDVSPPGPPDTARR